MKITTQTYADQIERWPSEGKHILAHYNDSTIIVYQAYNAEIGHFVLDNGVFGGAFSYDRMSWIKPNFLWMMYRSGWATKPDQEVILGLRLTRTFFDEILNQAVPSSFSNNLFKTEEKWQSAITSSNVRLQWDPDHDPLGNKLERRAIQLGLRGEMLERYGKHEIIEVINCTQFVKKQRECFTDYNKLRTPLEGVYQPRNKSALRHLELS